jgi:hypothetical protein
LTFVSVSALVFRRLASSGILFINVFIYRERLLCTLYGAADFLIVPSKGLHRWGGGGV